MKFWNAVGFGATLSTTLLALNADRVGSILAGTSLGIALISLFKESP